MKQCAYGYYTEIRQDKDKQTGVLEKCKFYHTGDYKSADLLFTIDDKGNMVHPYYLDLTKGFIPLSQKIEVTDEGVSRFIKSHKGVYGVLGFFVAVVEVNLRYDIKTGELVNSNICFYLPKTVAENSGDKQATVMICQKCASVDSFLTCVVQSRILDMYTAKIMDFFNIDIIDNKESYMRARLGL